MAMTAADVAMKRRRETPFSMTILPSSLFRPVQLGGHFLEMRGEPGAELGLLGRRPLAKALPGLEAEAAAGDEVLEVGQRPGRAVEVGEQLDMAIEREIGADEVGA